MADENDYDDDHDSDNEDDGDDDADDDDDDDDGDDDDDDDASITPSLISISRIIRPPSPSCRRCSELLPPPVVC